MDSAKLKNIILTILIITNALLLSLTVYQHLQSRQYRQQALSDAVDLLAAQGIRLQVQDLPAGDFPTPQVLESDEGGERRSFTALLGTDTQLTQRGLVRIYTGSLGSAEVREDGGFSVTLSPEAYPLAGQSIHYHATDVLQRMGFPCQVTAWTGDTVTAMETAGSIPVFSCRATLVYDQGDLVSITGTRLPGRAAADVPESAPLSTATLLIRFKSALAASGDTCSAILQATQGYTLRSDASRKLRLTPVLRLETDTNDYLLDAYTGALLGS